GPCVTRAELDKSRDEETQHDGAAVRLELEHVFARVRARRFEVEQEPAIYRRAARVAERAVVRVTRRRLAPEQYASDRRGFGAGDTDHADATGAGRCGHGGDGVALCHALTLWPSRRRRCAW